MWGKNFIFIEKRKKSKKDMCFHQRGENAMNIIKIYKYVPSM